MTTRDDSHGAGPLPADEPDSSSWAGDPGGSGRPAAGVPGPAEAAAGDEDAAAMPATASPADPASGESAAVDAAPARPLELWPLERRLPRLAADPAESSRLESALAAVARRLALLEEGRGGADGSGPRPPATTDALLAEVAAAVAPLVAACRPDGAAEGVTPDDAEATDDRAAAAAAPAAAGDEPAVATTEPGSHAAVAVAVAAGPPRGPSDPAASLERALGAWALVVLLGRLGVAAREHGRSLVPDEVAAGAPDFARRHVASARAGHGVDRDFLRQSRPRVRALADVAWERLAGTHEVLEAVRPGLRRAIAALLEHARHRLVRLERWGWETCLHEPAPLVVAAWRIELAARLGPPRWIAPEGVPPRPVIDDVEPLVPAGSDVGPAAAAPPREADSRDPGDLADGGDEPAPRDDADAAGATAHGPRGPARAAPAPPAHDRGAAGGAERSASADDAA